MRALSVAYPGCPITVLAHPKRSEVLQFIPFLARVGEITKRSALFRGWLPRRRYDFALVYGFDEPLVAYALRMADRVVAFRQRDEALNRRLYRAPEEPLAGAMHAVSHRMQLVSALGIPSAGGRLSYCVTPAEASAARARLAADLPAAGSASPLIGMNVATFPTKLFRRWPIEQFMQLSDRIVAEWPRAQILIFGGDEELEGARRLQQHLGERATLYAARLSLRESAALMSLTDLYVGLDTGLTHIMSAFDIPLIALYHCQIPSRQIAPLDHPALYVLDHPAQGDECTESTPLSAIAVETVFTQVRRALAEHPPRSAAGRPA